MLNVSANFAESEKFLLQVFFYFKHKTKLRTIFLAHVHWLIPPNFKHSLEFKT